MKGKGIGRRRKEEVIIDLTDTSGNNSMSVVRELDQDPVTGMVTMRSITDPPKKGGAFDDTPIHFTEEDKGRGYKEPPALPDHDGDYEGQLEKEGAFIVESTTYYPASGTTVTRRSQTPAEIAEEKGYHDFVEM
jgi:hypothetical protein